MARAKKNVRFPSTSKQTERNTENQVERLERLKEEDVLDSTKWTNDIQKQFLTH